MIVIPTYNMAGYLRKAIKSVLKQSYKNYEIIIIDNYSTDGTNKIIKKINSRKIKYFKLKNSGIIGKSRNLGIKKSKGNWIAFLDADDEWFPNRLLNLNKNIIKENFDVICSSEIIIDKMSKKKKIWHYGPNRNNFYEYLLRYGSRLSTSASAIKKNFIISKKILFSEKKKFSTFEDYDLFLNIAKENGKFFFLKKILGKHLFHKDSSTLKKKKSKESFYAVIKSHVKMQSFNKNKNKLFNQIIIYNKVQENLIDILLRKKIFKGTLKLIFDFILNPFIFLKFMYIIYKRQSNVESLK